MIIEGIRCEKCTAELCDAMTGDSETDRRLREYQNEQGEEHRRECGGNVVRFGPETYQPVAAA